MLQAQRTRSWVGAAATAACLTVTTGLVAMAGRDPLARSAPVNGSSASAPVTALLTLFAGAGVVMLAAFAMLLWQGRRRKGDDDDQLEPQPLRLHWMWQLAAILAALALGGALLAAAVIGARSGNTAPHPVTGGQPGHTPTGPVASQSSATGFVVPSWLPWTVLGIVVLALAVGVLLGLRRLGHAPDERSGQTAAGAAVAAAIGALEESADPREGVIAAYVAMQGTLAANGVVRSPSEAPREYLRRALIESSGTEREARTLTGLFEEARFSTHPISERARETALRALSSLRAHLREDGSAR